MPQAVQHECMLAVPLLLLTLAFQAQDAAPTQPPEKPKADCVIKGQVLNAVTGEPLRKARVNLMKPTARTGPRGRDVDSAGHFEFRGVEPGTYTLNAERTGFVTQSYGRRKPGRGMGGTSITLTPAQEMKDLVIKLSPHAVIVGRVIDEDGDPMAGVQISAMKSMWEGKKRQLIPVRNASTNDLGEYRIYDLAPDTYFIQAVRQRWSGMPPPSEPMSDKPEEGYIATWYPGTVDSSTSPRIAVKGGAELRGVDIRMVKTRVIRIRGKVLSGTTGKPTGGSVMLLPRGKGYRSWMEMKNSWVQDPALGFEFKDVTPGSYSLRGEAGSGDERESIVQNIDAGDSNIDNLVLQPNTGVEIRGKLTVEGGKLEGERTNVSLQPWEEDEGPMGGASAEPKQDGTFTLKNVQAGRYRIQCYKPDTYVKAIRAGDQDITDQPLDTSQGVPSSLEITLSANSPEVTGSVKNEDGKPVTGASVLLIPTDESRREQWGNYGQSTTDQNGNFRIRNTRPGEYKALALEEVEGGEFMDPDFLKAYECKATAVTLKEDSKENLQLTIIPVATTAQESEKKER